MNTCSKAILVFAQSAAREVTAKALPGRERLFEHLTSQAILKARRTGFPVFHFDEGRQEGNSFGERLSGAMKCLFDKGFDGLVVIGNDSPDLTTAALREAVSSLYCNEAVLGPSDDGGVYLIGLHREQFEHGEFLNLPWRQEDLFRTMVFWIQSKGFDITVLKHKMDLDCTRDFRNWTASFRYIDRKLSRLIAGMLHGPHRTDFQKRLRVLQSFYPFIRFNKGSPGFSP